MVVGSAAAEASAASTGIGGNVVEEWCAALSARGLDAPDFKLSKFNCVLRQAWELDDAGKAETLLRNLARHLEKDWEGVFASILEGLDKMLTVTQLGLPPELRRSLTCTNIIENVVGTVRRVNRNVKYWRSPSSSALGRYCHSPLAVTNFRA